jgi:lysophospholipase L1-like esterase
MSRRRHTSEICGDEALKMEVPRPLFNIAITKKMPSNWIEATRSRRFLFALIVAGMSVLLALLLCETAVRMFVPADMWQFRDATEDWQVDPVIGWVQKPNLRIHEFDGEFGWINDFDTNADGVVPATASRRRKSGVRRIMIFGDSIVLGRSVPENARLHVQLQAILSQGGRSVEVINAGVQGYSTDQEMLLIERLLPLYQPDLIILGVCDNDFDANAATTAYGIPKPTAVIRGGRVVEVFRPAPIKELPRFGRNKVSSLIQYSAVYRLVQPGILRLRLRFSRSARTVTASGLPPAFYYDRNSLKRVRFDIFEALLHRINQTAEANHARLLVFAHPALAETWNPYLAQAQQNLELDGKSFDRYALQNSLREISARQSVLFCPLIETFVRHQERGPFHLLPRDPHCNPAGYQLTAEILAQYISVRLPGRI